MSGPEIEASRDADRSTPWLVRSLWVGPPLSEMEWACYSSFVRHGARIELFTDDLARRVPRGVVVRDCREVLGATIPRYGPNAGKRAGSYAMAADVARIRTLLRDGGWWIDSDVICLKSFAPIDDGIRVGWQDVPSPDMKLGSANVAVMRLPPASVIARCLERLVRLPWLGAPWEPPLQRLRNGWRSRRTFFDPYDVWWGMTGGPEALTRAVHHFDIAEQVLPPEAFYPVHYANWRDTLTMTAGDLERLARNSYAVHLWAEMYRDVGMDKAAAVRAAPWAADYLEDFPAGNQ